MIIAREKRKTNIAEYILYMWQVEDMIRAFGFDIDKLYNSVFAQAGFPEDKAKEIKDWYENLAEIMRIEKVEKKGHVQVLKNIVNEVNELHLALLYDKKDPRYMEMITTYANNFVEFRQKSGVGNEVSDVELALNGLYGVLMLKLQKREISKFTATAMESFSKVLAYLSAKYKEMEESEK
jgi:hypothetical protein